MGFNRVSRGFFFLSSIEIAVNVTLRFGYIHVFPFRYVLVTLWYIWNVTFWLQFGTFRALHFAYIFCIFETLYLYFWNVTFWLHFGTFETLYFGDILVFVKRYILVTFWYFWNVTFWLHFGILKRYTLVTFWYFWNVTFQLHFGILETLHFGYILVFWKRYILVTF